MVCPACDYADNGYCDCECHAEQCCEGCGKPSAVLTSGPKDMRYRCPECRSDRPLIGLE